MQLLWKTVWRSLKKLKIKLKNDSAFPLLDIYLKKIKTLICKDISFVFYVEQYNLESERKCQSRSCVLLFMTPWTIACQAPLSMEFSRQEYWSGLPFPSPRELFNPGIERGSSASWTDSLLSEPPGNILTNSKYQIFFFDSLFS